VLCLYFVKRGGSERERRRCKQWIHIAKLLIFCEAAYFVAPDTVAVFIEMIDCRPYQRPFYRGKKVNVITGQAAVGKADGPEPKGMDTLQ
jgi:hypothetical protein